MVDELKHVYRFKEELSFAEPTSFRMNMLTISHSDGDILRRIIDHSALTASGEGYAQRRFPSRFSSDGRFVYFLGDQHFQNHIRFKISFGDDKSMSSEMADQELQLSWTRNPALAQDLDDATAFGKKFRIGGICTNRRQYWSSSDSTLENIGFKTRFGGISNHSRDSNFEQIQKLHHRYGLLADRAYIQIDPKIPDDEALELTDFIARTSGFALCTTDPNRIDLFRERHVLTPHIACLQIEDEKNRFALIKPFSPFGMMVENKAVVAVGIEGYDILSPR